MGFTYGYLLVRLTALPVTCFSSLGIGVLVVDGWCFLPDPGFSLVFSFICVGLTGILGIPVGDPQLSVSIIYDGFYTILALLDSFRLGNLSLPFQVICHLPDLVCLWFFDPQIFQCPETSSVILFLSISFPRIELVGGLFGVCFLTLLGSFILCIVFTWLSSSSWLSFLWFSFTPAHWRGSSVVFAFSFL